MFVVSLLGLLLSFCSSAMSIQTTECLKEEGAIPLYLPKNEKRPHEIFILDNGLQVLVGVLCVFHLGKSNC